MELRDTQIRYPQVQLYLSLELDERRIRETKKQCYYLQYFNIIQSVDQNTEAHVVFVN